MNDANNAVRKTVAYLRGLEEYMMEHDIDMKMGDQRPPSCVADELEAALSIPNAQAEQREAIARIIDRYAFDDPYLMDDLTPSERHSIKTHQPAKRADALAKADKIAAILAVRLDEAAIRKDGIYLVWSNEHSAWWGPNRAGYNTHISHAGRYTREEAIAICARARGGREFNSNPSEVPIPLKDAEAFWTEDGLEERYRRESRERKEEYEREEIEAASAIRNGGKQP